MKFMMIVKSSEKSGHPPQALMDEINKLIEILPSLKGWDSYWFHAKAGIPSVGS